MPAWPTTLRSRVDRGAAPARYARRAPPYGARPRVSAKCAAAQAISSRTCRVKPCMPLRATSEWSFVDCPGRWGLHVRVVSVEQNSDMAVAARSVEFSGGSHSACVLCESAKTFRVAVLALTVIFCCTHDVLQSSRAVANLLARARPFTRISPQVSVCCRPGLLR